MSDASPTSTSAATSEDFVLVNAADSQTATNSAPAPAAASTSTDVVAVVEEKKTHEFTPEKPTKYFVQVVDGIGNMGCSETELQALIEHAQLNSKNYAIVGIMGCQSSGKSTLLNLLFGTKFREMDAAVGRQQTTLGIWMDTAVTTDKIVVMDVEGTDSGERGEDRTTFERQTCMFALAMAEILVINMWENDIGRYTASNLGILKTIFEVNLQLFKNTNKMMLLFTIRDYQGSTPVANLREKVLEAVRRIWNEAQKPEDFKTAELNDFFDIEFVALPHKIFQPDLFSNAVGTLKERFVNPSHKEYLFNTAYHGSKSVPSDGFAHYTYSIWDTLKKNKDLNLPSQKEMLASFRCDEISKEAFNQFSAAIESLTSKVQEGYVKEFSSIVSKALEAALATSSSCQSLPRPYCWCQASRPYF